MQLGASADIGYSLVSSSGASEKPRSGMTYRVYDQRAI